MHKQFVKVWLPGVIIAKTEDESGNSGSSTRSLPATTTVTDGITKPGFI